MRRNAVLFVRERGVSEEEKESEVGATLLHSLSGTEAKEFYEGVISMPEESKHDRVGRKGRRLATRKKAQTNKQTKGVPTVSQVFGFVQEGDLGKLQGALSNGVCDVTTTDPYQWTLLMCAAHAGHTHIVQCLLSAGAKWREGVDRSGCTAVDLALKAGHISLAYLIETYGETATDRDGSVSAGNGKERTTHRRKSTTFFCEVCKQRVADRTQRHTTSTLHQFSCQHQTRGHSSSYVIPQSNRGYQMMLRSGWNPKTGLGCDQEGRKYPVKTVFKQDRLGFGQTDEKLSQGKAKVTHFAAFDERAVKRRSERFEKGPYLRKRDIVAGAKKDREWEVRMRRYMNSEHDFS